MMYIGVSDVSHAMVCKDMASNCRTRFEAGECDLEGSSMIGPGGDCRKMCKDCVSCASGDILCSRRNMRGLRGAGSMA